MLSLAAIAALTLTDANPELEKKARALVDQLIKGDFKTPQASFTDKMQAGLGEAKLAATGKQGWRFSGDAIKMAGRHYLENRFPCAVTRTPIRISRSFVPTLIHHWISRSRTF